MKWNKKILSLLYIGGLLLLIQSCDKVTDFGDLNSNPNATTEPNTGALLTNVLSGLGGTNWGGYPGSLTVDGGFYCQYFTESQYTETSRYQPPAINWDGTYSGPIYDLQNIILYNTSSPAKASNYGDNANQIAIARILKAYYFWFLTDMYGDLPYFDALKGTGIIKYDGQDKIYPDLLSELKSAVGQFVTPSIAMRGDIMYNGDISKWKKFANSIRLLIALRMSKKAATAGQAAFVEAMNDPNGIITSNTDNATINYPGGVYPNPIYAFYNIQQRFDVALCKTVTDILVANNDDRKSAFGTSTIGFPYGVDRTAASAFANANPNWAKLAATSTSPLVLIGAGNVYLARAEAATLGWTSENAASMYSQGIQNNWTQWGVYNSSDFTTYMANSSVDLSSGSAASKIGLQTWLAWFPNGWQGWSVWRKTNYPALTPAPQTPVLPIPRRIPYGSNEGQLNPDNYNTAATNYTVGGVPNSQDARMWWDQ